MASDAGGGVGSLRINPIHELDRSKIPGQLKGLAKDSYQ